MFNVRKDEVKNLKRKRAKYLLLFGIGRSGKQNAEIEQINEFINFIRNF